MRVSNSDDGTFSREPHQRHIPLNLLSPTRFLHYHRRCHRQRCYKKSDCEGEDKIVFEDISSVPANCEVFHLIALNLCVCVCNSVVPHIISTVVKKNETYNGIKSLGWQKQLSVDGKLSN
jgi:hypothetical protein